MGNHNEIHAYVRSARTHIRLGRGSHDAVGGEECSLRLQQASDMDGSVSLHLHVQACKKVS